MLKEKKIKADGVADIGKVFAVQKKRNAGRIIELLRVLFLFGTSLKTNKEHTYQIVQQKYPRLPIPPVVLKVCLIQIKF